jgi:hypothetical protein
VKKFARAFSFLGKRKVFIAGQEKKKRRGRREGTKGGFLAAL